jgi:hypothetical protein
MKAYRRNGGTDPLILNLTSGEVHDSAAFLRKELPVSFEWKSREGLKVLVYCQVVFLKIEGRCFP